MFLETLPAEVLRNICCHLDGISLARLSCTCRRLQNICSDESLWFACVKKEILEDVDEEFLPVLNKNSDYQRNWYKIYQSLHGAASPYLSGEGLDLTTNSSFTCDIPEFPDLKQFTLSFWFFLARDADTRDFRALCLLNPHKETLNGSLCLLLGDEDNRCHVSQIISSNGNAQSVDEESILVHERDSFLVASRVHSTLKELPFYEWSQIVLVCHPQDSDEPCQAPFEIFLNGESHGVKFALPVETNLATQSFQLIFGSVDGRVRLPNAYGHVRRILLIPRAVDSLGLLAIFHQTSPFLPYPFSWILSARNAFNERVNEIVHASKSCDFCHIFPMKGIIYRCLECFPSYDLCMKCFASDEFILGPALSDHRDDHLFLPVRRPCSFRYFTYFRRHYSTGLISVTTNDSEHTTVGSSRDNE
ncbi:hypothetical protein GpartN1_g2724.t1 [Galdieria partita]|uniref:F-box domain-containing protein n=1 Tax=Galdieria partita TaxID=83374 RepID=A0A9C7PU93_9RHOD|nr:hypothetical protein GpartN1_g2724.t1 [Galdieria partita]